MQVQQTAVQTDRVWTVPNILSMFRLAMIPLFAWLVLGAHEELVAAAVLALGGLTDYLDGAIARRTGQISRLGQLLDPLADRLSTLTVLVVYLVAGILPVWFVLVLLARDGLLAWFLAKLRKDAGITGLPVHFVGKLATFCLLAGFPLLLVGHGAGPGAGAASALGWALAGWGAWLYWYSAVLYIWTARAILGAAKGPLADGSAGSGRAGAGSSVGAGE